MTKRLKQQITNDALLALVPKGATRVQVIDEFGNLKYKDFLELSDTDVIQANKRGEPVVMMTKPGRRQIPELKPATPIVAEMLRQKEKSLEDDPILVCIKQDPESADVLNLALQALAEEAASIGFERKEAERRGEDTSNYSVRRVNTLKTVADAWFKRKEQISAREIDLKSPMFQALFGWIMETFGDAMRHCGIRGEMSETVFSKIAKEMESGQWEAEARRRMRDPGIRTSNTKGSGSKGSAKKGT